MKKRTQQRNELNFDDPSEVRMEVVRDEPRSEHLQTEEREHDVDFDELEATPDELSSVVLTAIVLIFALVLLAGALIYFL